METANRIRELRESIGLTRKDFSEHIGIPVRTLEDWETVDLKDHNNNEILIYQSENGITKIDVKIVDEIVWLTQAQLCELY